MPSLTPRNTAHRHPSLRVLLLLMAALQLGGCLSKSQFYGSYAEDTKSRFDEYALLTLEVKSYREYSYNFWGDTYRGYRMHFGARSLVNYPLCVTVKIDRAKSSLLRQINDGQEYRIEPGQTVWVADVLFSPNLRQAAYYYDLQNRRC